MHCPLTWCLDYYTASKILFVNIHILQDILCKI